MAGNTFYLKIISANRVFFSGRCRSLIVPEYDGQKEILAHHEDMVIAIDEGEMRFQPEGTPDNSPSNHESPDHPALPVLPRRK